ncbi:MAG: hypothetical protein AB7P21_13165 [Lautropia sp.]
MNEPRWSESSTGLACLDDAARDDPAFNIRLGAYYPTGHALFMLASPEEAKAVAAVLPRVGTNAGGHPEARLLTPEATARFMQQALDEGGLLAGIVAAEAKQTKMLLELARAGHAMLAVRIDDEAHKDAIVAALGERRVPKALYYHTLAIEELPVSIDAAPGSDVYGMNERPREEAPRR